MFVPTGLPLLRHGPGDSPEDGGCFVQVAGFLSEGHSWSDNTPLVHPVIRSAGVLCNDLMSATARPRLAPLAADAAGTGPEPSGATGQILRVRLLAWVALRVSPRWENRQLCQNAVSAALDWADCPCPEHQKIADRGWRAMHDLPYVASQQIVRTVARTASVAPYRMPSPTWGVSAAIADAVMEATDADQTMYDFMWDLLGEHRRLTGHTPAGFKRWHHVCDLLGTTKEVITA